MIFQTAPNLKAKADFQKAQAVLEQQEKDDHELIDIEKKIEVMDKYQNENEFILSALQER